MALLQERVLQAVNSDNIELLRDLKVENPDLQWTRCYYVKSGDSPLHIAARSGNLEIVKFLIEEWSSPRCIEATNWNGKTAMHEAAHFSQSEVIEYLFDHGAEVNVLKRSDWTPLMLACTRSGFKAVQTVKTLLECGADLSLRNKDGWTALHIAAREGDPDVVGLLSDASTDITTRTSCNGRTALHTAAIHGHASVVKLLLKLNPSSVDLKDTCGSTPLMDAVRSGDVLVAQILLDFGASLETRDAMGLSCLHIAAQVGCLDMIYFLVDTCKQDINCKSDRGGLTPYDCAKMADNFAAMNLLKKISSSEESDNHLKDRLLKILQSGR